jgi:outer membrane protein, multidrug efflux system
MKRIKLECRDTRAKVGLRKPADRSIRPMRLRLLSCAFLFASSGLAQVPTHPVPQVAERVAPQDPSPAPVASGEADHALVAIPSRPEVSDPMLVELPRPQRQLGSWQEALTQLRARSTDLATAYAEVLKAEAQSRIALAALLPTITGTATVTHQLITSQSNAGYVSTTTSTVSTSSDTLAGSLSLTQPLVDVKAWYDLRTARAAEVIQRLGVQSVKRSMTLSLATAVVSVVTAERVAEINRLSLRSALELLELTKKKAVLGTAMGLDVVRAEQNVSSTRSSIVSGDESLRQAREALGLALGEPQEVGVAAGIKIDELVGVLDQSCQKLKSPLERPEVQAANQQLKVNERLIRSAELSFLPTLRAQSTLSESTSLSLSSPRTTWSISAVLSVPIWDGGARYGNLRNARASRDEAAYTIEAKRRTITIEVQQASRSVQVAEQSLDVASKSAELAARNDALTRISFQLGKGTTSFELVAAAVALQQAQVQMAVQEFGLVNARLQALLTMARCSDAS